MFKYGIAGKCAVFASASLIVFASISSASAGDRGAGAPVGRTVWSGPYLGLHAGYGWGDISIADGGTAIDNNTFGAFACAGPVPNYCNKSFDLPVNGAVGGAHLGMNWQTGNLVLGVEGELTRADVDGDKTLSRPNNDKDFASASYDWYATLTGRVGYSMDRSLVYIKGGAAFAEAEIRAADIDNGAIYAGSEVRSSEHLRGWTLGAGWEYALTRQVSLKAEYNYLDFGTVSARSSDGDIYDHDAKLHTAKIGVSFKLQP